MDPASYKERNLNKVVIVTGAGRGIGAETALLLAERGYKVCVNYLRNEHKASLVVDKIRENGGIAIACQADVSIEQDVKRLFAETQHKLGSVTHLVNNAARLEQQTTLAELSLDRVQRLLNTNVSSCFLCCKEALNYMKDGGAIVNVSSLASISGAPFEYVDYAATKGAVDSLTVGLAKEVASKGIRVNGVRPALIYTDMHTDGGEAGRVDRLADTIPLGRGGKAIEVAYAIAWLLSEEASFVTGTFINVAGGK